MNNVNVVSTPNITGNIGSCKTEVTHMTIGRNGFWTEQIQDIATNSCTGQVTTSEYWSYTGGGSFMLFTIPLLIFMFLIGWINN